MEKVHNWAKEIGYTSISHDLVFGLPHQSIEGISNTIDRTNELQPDRISFYSYAHVPWIKGLGQRGFEDKDIPNGEQKRALYELGKELFDKNGYTEIGMDHFALKNDSLYHSMKNKSLHRNFMGYTTNSTRLMIGLGMSSISDSWYAFAQNLKTVEEYQKVINEGQLPIFKGHLLNSEDLEIRRIILDLMCKFETKWENNSIVASLIPDILKRLAPLEADGLVEINENHVRVTDEGRIFVRNICMAFDARLHRSENENRLFSLTV